MLTESWGGGEDQASVSPWKPREGVSRRTASAHRKMLCWIKLDEVWDIITRFIDMSGDSRKIREKMVSLSADHSFKEF